MNPRLLALNFLVDKLGQWAATADKSVAAEFADLQAEFSKRRAKVLRSTQQAQPSPEATRELALKA